jgi:hypothetical protein
MVRLGRSASGFALANGAGTVPCPCADQEDVEYHESIGLALLLTRPPVNKSTQAAGTAAGMFSTLDSGQAGIQPFHSLCVVVKKVVTT